MSERGSAEGEDGRVESLFAQPAVRWQTDNLRLGFKLDDERREAIARCLERGDLRLVLNNVSIDIVAGRGLHTGDGYLWD
jgi:hypothetical protein